MEKSGGCCGGKPKQPQQDSTKKGSLQVRSKSYQPRQSADQSVIEAKVVLLGDSGVGKSSIAQRFCKNVFQEGHDVTIGGAYLQQTVSLQNPDTSVGGTIQVKLHIWDTGGSEKFRSMISLYYKDAAAAIICYDVSDERTFNSVHYWVNEMINNNNSESDNFVMAMAANKCDLDASMRKVPQSATKDLAKKHNMIMADTSAKTGEGVQQMFRKVAEKIAVIKKMEQ